LWAGEGALHCGKHAVAPAKNDGQVFLELQGEASDFTGQLEQKCITVHMDWYLDAWSMLSEAHRSRKTPT